MKKITLCIIVFIVCSCSKENRISEIELDTLQTIYMLDMVRCGETVIGLDQNKIAFYDQGRRQKEIIVSPDPQAHLMQLCKVNDRLFGLLGNPWLLGYNSDSLIFEKELPFYPWDISPWQADSLLVLGQYKNKIFHAFDHDGNYARSFGAIPEDVHPRVGPRYFFVNGRTIYVAGADEYAVFVYENETIQDTLHSPEPELITGHEVETVGSVDTFFMLNGISGLGVYKDILYVSIFHHQLRGSGQRHHSSTFYIDAFDIKTKKRVFHRAHDNIFLLHADNEGLYLLTGNKIRHWRGINDKNFAF